MAVPTTPPMLPAARPDGSLLADYSGLCLSDIPGDIPGHLYALNLSRNALVRLPPGLGQTFSGLCTLDVSGNRLSALPEDIGGLQCLRELYAHRNALEGLPASVGSLRRLEALNVSDNCLARLPACLGLLTESLHVLLVDGNPLSNDHRVLVQPIVTGSQSGSQRKIRARPDAKVHSHLESLKELFAAGLAGSRRSRSASVQQRQRLFRATTASGRNDSTSSTSQSSRSSSGDAGSIASHNEASVKRVLWRLRDEWDLDPSHGRSDSPGDTRVDEVHAATMRAGGLSTIDRAYREKAPTASNSQRMKILSELLVTEVTYVDTLKNVVGVFLNPMREARILAEYELREIFSNVEVILAFHNDHFLPAIAHAISQPEMAIGDVFLHHSAHFRLYSAYTNNHETSTQALSNVMSRRTVSSFIQSARRDVTQLGQVSLDGHLLTPVQRLPRYRMLLTDLLRSTPSTHPDHEPLFAAATELNVIIHEVNEKKRAFEDQAQLRRLQERLAGAAAIPLVAPHRVFRLEASFRLQ
ncbi:hypothetical protein IWQ56_005019, partial [Coemansia nantahalensis]